MFYLSRLWRNKEGKPHFQILKRRSVFILIHSSSFINYRRLKTIFKSSLSSHVKPPHSVSNLYQNPPNQSQSPLKFICTMVTTVILGYGLLTGMIRNFFPFPFRKRFRKSLILERFFPVNPKFPACFEIKERPGI